MSMLKMCWNWKVLAGLATAALAMYLVAPNAILAIFPILALLACPLSMVVMMRGMGGMPQGQAEAQGQPAPQATGAPLTREQQLAQLRSQLLSLGDQQAALAEQIERLEAAKAAPTPNGAAQRIEPVAHAAAPPHELGLKDTLCLLVRVTAKPA